jgi:hypothetical protein
LILQEINKKIRFFMPLMGKKNGHAPGVVPGLIHPAAMTVPDP